MPIAGMRSPVRGIGRISRSLAAADAWPDCVVPGAAWAPVSDARPRPAAAIEVLIRNSRRLFMAGVSCNLVETPMMDA
jgi:hypothetical protein